MKILYLDCHMGAAGDMLTAALYELLDENERTEFIKEVNSLGLPGIEFIPESALKCGVSGTHMKVLVHGHEEHSGEDHNHDHHHTSLSDVKRIISELGIPAKAKEDVESVYKAIAEAESQVHGIPMDQIHFHEVGTLDAIADVVAVCLLMEKINPDRIVASEVHVGSGQVKCAHGILPVPAPATELLLQGIPTYGGKVKGELCTPTGAALLRHFVSDFGSRPAMSVEKTGYGCGKKDFDQANLVRASLGQNASSEAAAEVIELQCNLDDMTGEEIGFATEVLLDAGALDVYTISIGMKKNRPGILLTVMCKIEDRQKFVELIFKHTTTIGIRENTFRRYTLDRKLETVDTEYGPIRRKVVEGYGTHREKWEYEDLSRIARERGVSVREVKELI